MLIGSKVDVYRNLRTGGFSVRKQGKVVHWSDSVAILNPQFVVSEKGRWRVLEQKRKHVHAVVRGLYVETNTINENIREAYYNPYTTATFIDKETGEPLYEAKYAFMIDGKLFYSNEER